MTAWSRSISAKAIVIVRKNLPERRGGVDRLRHRRELGAVVAELGEQVGEVTRPSGSSVQLPDDERVGVALADHLAGPVEAGSFLAFAGGAAALGDRLHESQSFGSTERFDRFGLDLRGDLVLVVDRHADVADHVVSAHPTKPSIRNCATSGTGTRP